MFFFAYEVFLQPIDLHGASSMAEAAPNTTAGVAFRSHSSSTPNRRENGPGLHRGLEKVIFGRFQKKYEKKQGKRSGN